MEQFTIVIIALVFMTGILGAYFSVILSKLKVIHVLTNSNLHETNERLDTALAEIKSLNRLVMELRDIHAKPS